MESICAGLEISEARFEQLMLGDWAVRVVVPVYECVNLKRLVMGLETAEMMTILRDDADGICFDIHCSDPTEDSQRWSRHLATALEARGLNAVSAPRWRGE